MTGDYKVHLSDGAEYPDTSADDLLADIRNGTWLDRQEFAPLAYAVPGIIPEGLTLHVGAPKIGKSWKVLSHALAIASGGITLDVVKVGDPRPVLYLALEDGDRRMQDRCRKLLRGEPIPELFDYLTRVQPGLVIVTITAWLDRHADQQPLVILDTLGKVMPPALQGESAYQRDYRIGSALHAVCDDHPGMALVVNHHDRKANADDFVEMVSGTNGLAGAADTILVICRDRNESAGLLKVTGRDVPEDEYAVELQDGYHWRLDGADLGAAAERAQKVRATTKATANVGDRLIDVVLYVHAHPEGVRAGDVAKALQLDDATARTYLGRAVKAGRLERPERGLYIPVASVASVASEGPAEQGALPLSNTSNTRNTPMEATS